MNNAKVAQLRSWDLVREAQGLPSLVNVITDNEEQINYISRFVEHLRTYNVHLKSSYQGVPEDIYNKELRSFIQTFLDEENNIGERPAKPRRISSPRR